YCPARLTTTDVLIHGHGNLKCDYSSFCAYAPWCEPPGELIGLLVAARVLFWVHPLLGVGVLITLPLVLGLMHWVASPLRKRSRTEQAGLADAAASAADMGTGYRVIRGLHAQHTASHRYRSKSRSTLDTTLA